MTAFVRFIHRSLFMAQCFFFFFALVIECCTVPSAGTILIKLQCWTWITPLPYWEVNVCMLCVMCVMHSLCYDPLVLRPRINSAMCTYPFQTKTGFVVGINPPIIYLSIYRSIDLSLYRSICLSIHPVVTMLSFPLVIDVLTPTCICC